MQLSITDPCTFTNNKWHRYIAVTERKGLRLYQADLRHAEFELENYLQRRTRTTVARTVFFWDVTFCRWVNDAYCLLLAAQALRVEWQLTVISHGAAFWKTWCNNFSSLLLDVYWQLNMFRASSRPSSGAQQLQQQPLVLPSKPGDSSDVGRGWAGRPAWPRTQYDYHHETKVIPEAATAIIEFLMMGGKTPETCWAVNKRQDNKLKIVVSGWWFIWIKCKTPVPKV